MTLEESEHESGLKFRTHFWPILKSRKLQFLMGAFLILMSTLFEVGLPLVIGHLTDVVIASHRATQALIGMAFLYLAMIIGKSVLDFFQASIIQMTGQRVTDDLRHFVFEKILTLPIPFFDKNPTGKLLTRVINDIKSLSELFTASMSVLALDLLVIVATVIAMLTVQWKLALWILLTFPLVVFSIWFFGERMAESYRLSRRKLSEMNAFLGEHIGAIATVQRLVAEKERMNKFAGIVNDHYLAQMNSVKTFALVQPTTNILNGVAMATLLIVGGRGVSRGELSVGIIVAFLGYLRNIFQPVRDLVENSFITLLSVDQTGIEFEDVSFQYASRGEPALSHISFTLPPKSSLAIVGHTGSGKSTLVKLLLRFYEPAAGKILFSGRSLSEWNLTRLRKNMGVIHQDVYLFAGDIRQNLLMGRTAISDSFLIEECQRAQLWELIKGRGGLDMQVLEGGSNLSLGERQLVSFARCLISNSPVLILDEATSNIDRLIERRLIHAISEILSERTAIVIAHRLSTIRRCDKVMVLNKGAVHAMGSYEDLLLSDPVFSQFHAVHSDSAH